MLRIIIFYFAFWSVTAYSQPVKFQMVYGGSDYDYFKFIDTLNASYIVAGNSKSFGVGDYDFFISKYDTLGTLLSIKTFGGIQGEILSGYLKMNNGKYLLSGVTRSFGFNTPAQNNGLLICIDSTFNISWTKVIEGIGDEWMLNAVQLPNDSFVYIVGKTSSVGSGSDDIFLAKLTSSGNFIWQKALGTVEFENACEIKVTKDNSLGILLGVGSQSNSEEISFVKVDTSGTILWSKIFQGNLLDHANAFCCTADSGYAITGDGLSYGFGSYDVYVIKLDKNGNMQWTSTYGDIFDDYSTDIVELTDDLGNTRNYFICGHSPGLEDDSASTWGNHRGFILCTDQNGIQQWLRMYGVGPSDYLYELQLLQNGGLIAVGATGAYGQGILDGWFIKTDFTGNSYCNQINNFAATTNPIFPVISNCTSMVVNLNIISPTIQTTIPAPVTTIICNSNILTSSGEDHTKSSIDIYPNPSMGLFHIESQETIERIVVFDVMGKQILHKDFTTKTFDLSGLSEGLYFVNLYSEKGITTQKIVLSYK